jgi:hypothetical protein
MLSGIKTFDSQIASHSTGCGTGTLLCGAAKTAIKFRNIDVTSLDDSWFI